MEMRVVAIIAVRCGVVFIGSAEHREISVHVVKPSKGFIVIKASKSQTCRIYQSNI